MPAPSVRGEAILNTKSETMTMTLLNWTIMLKIFWTLESGQNMHPPANGDCVGPFQISTVFMQDANRILGKTKYHSADREDYWKSQEMVLIVLQYYHAKATIKDVGRIALAYRCGEHGSKMPTADQFDYAQRAVNLYKDAIRPGSNETGDIAAAKTER
jgi:hypothetical protein